MGKFAPVPEAVLGEEPKMRKKPAEPVQGRREQLFMWTLMMRDIAQGRATRNAFES